jgi:hypothetical protein
VWPSPTTFIAAAMAWTGAGLARLLSIAVDRNLSRLNVAGLTVELLFGSLLWTGAA